MGRVMGITKTPPSLRAETAYTANTAATAGKISSVAGLIAVASFGGADAQPSNLPPVTVDAPVARPRPAAPRPTPDQVRARNALRRAARAPQPVTAAPVPFANFGGFAGDRDPYANPNAPYQGERLQASGKFPERIANTPRSITVLTKEVLEDKNATTLRDAVRTTAGVTLGTGEGGNAFGDRFFIRGFDARNDIFIDGVRDPGVSIRENFFTEQVEILRGPASSFAGRGTAGGAINIVTKQASMERNFYNMDTTLATDQTKRIVLDVNQIISPTLAVRAGGLFQEANVAGRNYVTDNRNGAFAAVKWTHYDAIKVTANYIHTDLSGIPDFGVPYFRPGAPVPAGTQFTTTAGGPYTEYGINRANFYGFVNRDRQTAQQDIGSLNAEIFATPDLIVTNKLRVQRSVLDYIGTLPEGPNNAAGTVSANPQSRHQVTDVVANQTEAAYKFGLFGFRHTAIGGVELSKEQLSFDSYSGLSSEALPGGFSGTGSLSNVSIVAPQFTFLPFNGTPTLTGRPTNLAVGTKSFYVADTANYNDFVILNGGVRYDDYNINVNGFGTVNGVANTRGAQSQQYGLTNYNGGIVVKPLPIVSLYAAYATSSNPVGAEFDGTTAQYGGLAAVVNGNPNQVFGPEQNKAAEVGTKVELFERRLLVTAALFQTEKENAREIRNIANAAAATPGCPYTATTGTQPCISAGAAYRIQGIDLGAGGKITDKLSVFAGLVLMKSEVSKSLIPPANTALFTSNVGLPLANVAHQSFNVLAKYQFTDVWELGGQATYRSKIEGGTYLAANQGTSIPDYWRFDAFLEAKVSPNWRVKVFANNLTNKLYYDGLYQSATPFVLVAPGRSVSAVISARF